MSISTAKEVEDLKSKIIDRERYSQLIGESQPVLNVLRLIQKVEKSNMMVMITGESGTGKEVVAKVVHYNSTRKKGTLCACKYGSYSRGPDRKRTLFPILKRAHSQALTVNG